MKPGKKKKKNAFAPDCGSTYQIWSLFLPAVIPEVRPEVFGGKLDNEDIKNIIPEPVVTPLPKIHQQPFDYEEEVYTGSQTEENQEYGYPEEEEEKEEDQDNQLNPRGDVFSRCPFVWLPWRLSVAGSVGGPSRINYALSKHTQHVSTAALLLCVNSIWMQLSISQ